MKKNFVTMSLLLSLTLLVCGQDANHAVFDEHGGSVHHAHASDRSANFKLEFENDSILVVRIRIGPHEKLPMHDLTPRVVVLLTDQNLRVTFPNGKTREEHHLAGET